MMDYDVYCVYTYYTLQCSMYNWICASNCTTNCSSVYYYNKESVTNMFPYINSTLLCNQTILVILLFYLMTSKKSL